MVDSLTTRLRALLTRAKLSQEAFAKRCGFEGASSVQRYLNPKDFDDRDGYPGRFIKRAARALAGLGEPPIREEEVMALAELRDLTLPQLKYMDQQPEVWCIGEVAAGVWREAFEWPRDDWLPVVLSVPDTRYRGAERRALRVMGDSMDELYPSGSLIVFVRLGDIGRRPQHADKVVVLRKRQSLTEATVKIYSKDAQGRRWLVPRSSNPQHTAILLEEPEDASETIEIMGLVVGSQTLE